VKVSTGFTRKVVQAPGPATSNEKSTAKETILLVDDEPGILSALAFQLEPSYEVVTRDRPADALALLETLDAAAIVSDQRMPGMTGSELLAASARLRPDAARILLTGYADLTAVIDAVNEGQIYFYLTKPWRPAELEAVLSRGVERWRFLREREHLVAGLERANAELEARVAERTDALERQNAELERVNDVIARLARTDALTGLANRRALDESLPRERERARREQKPLAALALDLDHFKRVNDNWGHAVGDLLLAAVGETLRSSVRPYDLAVRTGGEEFLLLLPGAANEAAAMIAERIRGRIGQLVVEGLPERVTASAGVAVLSAAESANELLARADRALYQAKERGRDRVVRAEPG
jgi:diguanylate cyclase (GGDEF)-like protein